MHDAVAARTRACAYSRAGILASDPAVGERDAEGVAEELHTLLERAGEHPPLVLVAHSLGGLYALTYVRKFDSDVMGLVLVDILHPDSIRRMEAAGVHVPLSLGPLQLADRLRWTGLMRLLGPDDEDMAYELASLSGMRAEMEALDRSLAQAGALRALGSRPVSVLSAGQVEPELLVDAQLTAEQGKTFLAVKRNLNEDLASWSSRGQHEVVTRAMHGIQWQAPDAVIGAAHWVIDAVRADLAR